MNNSTLIKWVILLTLLLITLVLVWRAPEVEAPQLVEPVKQGNRTKILNPEAAAKVHSSTVDIVLKQRDFSGKTVDLFAVPARPKPVRPKESKPVKQARVVKRLKLPFRYVGKLEEQQKVIYFLMEGTSLYLAQKGDVINEQFRLENVDDDSNELVWLHLPTNQTSKMSTEQ
jgi:hypothetical protein